jgi:hypothetical protein
VNGDAMGPGVHGGVGNLAPRPYVPDPEDAYRHDPPPVGREGAGVERSVLPDDPHQDTRPHVPDPKAGRSRRDDPVPVGREGAPEGSDRSVRRVADPLSSSFPSPDEDPEACVAILCLAVLAASHRGRSTALFGKRQRDNLHAPVASGIMTRCLWVGRRVSLPMNAQLRRGAVDVLPGGPQDMQFHRRSEWCRLASTDRTQLAIARTRAPRGDPVAV